MEALLVAAVVLLLVIAGVLAFGRVRARTTVTLQPGKLVMTTTADVNDGELPAEAVALMRKVDPSIDLEAVERALHDAKTDALSTSTTTAGGLTVTRTVVTKTWSTPNAKHPLDIAGLGRITAADHEFDLAAFLAQSSQLFVDVLHSVSDGDLRPVRPYLDDAALSALEARVRERGTAEETLKQLRVDGANVVTSSADGDRRMVRVRFLASCVGTRRDPATHELLDAERFGDGVSRRSFAEEWTFARPADAKTARAEAATTKCPTCGAAAEGEHPAVCRYCGTNLGAARFGWTVSAVTKD